MVARDRRPGDEVPSVRSVRGVVDVSGYLDRSGSTGSVCTPGRNVTGEFLVQRPEQSGSNNRKNMRDRSVHR